MLRRVLVAAMVVVIAAVGAMAQAGRRSNPMEVHPCRLRLRVVSELDQRGLRDLTVEVMDATGKSNAEDCDCALQLIVPRFQRAYDVVRKH